MAAWLRFPGAGQVKGRTSVLGRWIVGIIARSCRFLSNRKAGSDARLRRMMKYKGYEGTVRFDEDAGIFYGEIVNTHDVITFQGTSVAELQKAFRDSIDDYLSFCAEQGEEPDKPFSGNFVVRIPPDLHRELYTEAKKEGKSLNSLIEEKLAS